MFVFLKRHSVSEGEQQDHRIVDELEVDLLPKNQDPTPSTVANKPDIWTEKMWGIVKLQYYPWLFCKNGELGCLSCVSAKDLGPNKTQGLYLSPEWQTANVTYNGLSQEAKLASLRKKIFKHMHSDAHIKAKRHPDSAEEQQYAHTSGYYEYEILRINKESFPYQLLYS